MQSTSPMSLVGWRRKCVSFYLVGWRRKYAFGVPSILGHPFFQNIVSISAFPWATPPQKQDPIDFFFKKWVDASTVGRRNIATKQWGPFSFLFKGSPPDPQFQCWRRFYFSCACVWGRSVQHWNWGRGGISCIRGLVKLLQYFSCHPWRIVCF